MIKLFEIEIEVLVNDNFSIDDIRSSIKDSLDDNINIDLTHIQVEISEKKAKEWIIDNDRKIPLLKLEKNLNYLNSIINNIYTLNSNLANHYKEPIQISKIRHLIFIELSKLMKLFKF